MSILSMYSLEALEGLHGSGHARRAVCHHHLQKTEVKLSQTGSPEKSAKTQAVVMSVRKESYLTIMLCNCSKDKVVFRSEYHHTV